MDTLVTDGDFPLDVCAFPYRIISLEEACQRVRFILTVKKGSFAYDRDLGVDFSSLENCGDNNKTAKLLCEEALAKQSEIQIGDVSVVAESSGIRTLSIEVIYKNKSKTVEVKI